MRQFKYSLQDMEKDTLTVYAVCSSVLYALAGLFRSSGPDQAIPARGQTRLRTHRRTLTVPYCRNHLC